MKIIKEGNLEKLKKLSVLNVKNAVVSLKQRKMNIDVVFSIMKFIIIVRAPAAIE